MLVQTSEPEVQAAKAGPASAKCSDLVNPCISDSLIHKITDQTLCSTVDASQEDKSPAAKTTTYRNAEELSAAGSKAGTLTSGTCQTSKESLLIQGQRSDTVLGLMQELVDQRSTYADWSSAVFRSLDAGQTGVVHASQLQTSAFIKQAWRHMRCTSVASNKAYELICAAMALASLNGSSTVDSAQFDEFAWHLSALSSQAHRECVEQVSSTPINKALANLNQHGGQPQADLCCSQPDGHELDVGRDADEDIVSRTPYPTEAAETCSSSLPRCSEPGTSSLRPQLSEMHPDSDKDPQSDSDTSVTSVQSRASVTVEDFDRLPDIDMTDQPMCREDVEALRLVPHAFEELLQKKRKAHKIWVRNTFPLCAPHIRGPIKRVALAPSPIAPHLCSCLGGVYLLPNDLFGVINLASRRAGLALTEQITMDSFESLTWELKRMVADVVVEVDMALKSQDCLVAATAKLDPSGVVAEPPVAAKDSNKADRKSLAESAGCAWHGFLSRARRAHRQWVESSLTVLDKSPSGSVQHESLSGPVFKFLVRQLLTNLSITDQDLQVLLKLALHRTNGCSGASLSQEGFEACSWSLRWLDAKIGDEIQTFINRFIAVQEAAHGPDS